jgi:hypothetical protein
MPVRRPITPKRKRPPSTCSTQPASEAQLHRLLLGVVDALTDALSRETKREAAFLACAVKLLRACKVRVDGEPRSKAALKGSLLNLRDRLGRG